MKTVMVRVVGRPSPVTFPMPLSVMLSSSPVARKPGEEIVTKPNSFEGSKNENEIKMLARNQIHGD